MCASIRYRQPIQFAHSQDEKETGRFGTKEARAASGRQGEEEEEGNLILIGPQYSVQGGVSNISPHTRIADISSPLIYIPTTRTFFLFFSSSSSLSAATLVWWVSFPHSISSSGSSILVRAFWGCRKNSFFRRQCGGRYLILSPPLLLVSPYDLRGYFPPPQWMLSTASFPAPHLKIKFDNFPAEQKKKDDVQRREEEMR